MGTMEIFVDGKGFELEYVNIPERSNTPEGFFLREVAGIFIDDETLFTTKTNEVLVNGAPVRLFYAGDHCIPPQRYMKDLRKSVEREQLKRAAENYKRMLPQISNTLQSVLEAKQHLGKKQIATTNGGYGDCEPVWSFVCMVLKKNGTLSLDIMKDEEAATRQTQKAVEHVYYKSMQNKKGLSPEAKQEYDKEVENLREGLNIENLEERTSYLAELYDELKA